MAPRICNECGVARAVLRRPKTSSQVACTMLSEATQQFGNAFAAPPPPPPFS